MRETLLGIVAAGVLAGCTPEKPVGETVAPCNDGSEKNSIILELGNRQGRKLDFSYTEQPRLVQSANLHREGKDLFLSVEQTKGYGHSEGAELVIEGPESTPRKFGNLYAKSPVPYQGLVRSYEITNLGYTNDVIKAEVKVSCNKPSEVK